MILSGPFASFISSLINIISLLLTTFDWTRVWGIAPRSHTGRPRTCFVKLWACGGVADVTVSSQSCGPRIDPCSGSLIFCCSLISTASVIKGFGGEYWPACFAATALPPLAIRGQRGHGRQGYQCPWFIGLPVPLPCCILPRKLIQCLWFSCCYYCQNYT